MKWTLEKRKISSLREYAKNPRRLSKHDAKHLQESIEKFGQCEPIVINCDDTIIGGHQRLRTLKKLKYKEVEVYVPDSPLSEKEVEELNIRLNRNAGDWDDDMLANAWNLRDLLDWGFTQDELDVDLDVLEGTKTDEKEDTIIEPPKNAKTKLGDLYELGEHRLLCGDTTIPDDVNRLFEGKEIIIKEELKPKHFIDSGISIISAERLNKQAFCIESDPECCDFIIEMWIKEQFRNNKPSKVIKNGKLIDWRLESGGKNG